MVLDRMTPVTVYPNVFALTPRTLSDSIFYHEDAAVIMAMHLDFQEILLS